MAEMVNISLEMYNALMDVCDEQHQLFEALNQYRKTKDERKLFQVRTHENNLRKLHKTILIEQLKTKAA